MPYLANVFTVRVDDATAQGLVATAKALGMSTASAHRLAVETFVSAMAQSLNKESPAVDGPPGSHDPGVRVPEPLDRAI